jgi:hypothetical protein
LAIAIIVESIARIAALGGCFPDWEAASGPFAESACLAASFGIGDEAEGCHGIDDAIAVAILAITAIDIWLDEALADPGAFVADGGACAARCFAFGPWGAWVGAGGDLRWIAGGDVGFGGWFGTYFGWCIGGCVLIRVGFGNRFWLGFWFGFGFGFGSWLW